MKKIKGAFNPLKSFFNSTLQSIVKMSISSSTYPKTVTGPYNPVEIFDDAISVVSEGNSIRDLMPIEAGKVHEDCEIFGLPKSETDYHSNDHLKKVMKDFSGVFNLLGKF